MDLASLVLVLFVPSWVNLRAGSWHGDTDSCSFFSTVGRGKQWVLYPAACSPICTLYHGYSVCMAAGTALTDHVDTTHEPRGREGAASSETTVPLGSSGHFSGCIGRSCTSAGLGSGPYVQGGKCGKVGEPGKYRESRGRCRDG